MVRNPADSHKPQVLTSHYFMLENYVESSRPLVELSCLIHLIIVITFLTPFVRSLRYTHVERVHVLVVDESPYDGEGAQVREKDWGHRVSSDQYF